MIESIKPTGILRKYIINYFIVETNNSVDYLPKERVYPCGYATMVFHYGSPSKFQKKNSSIYIEPNLVICGQQTSYYDLSLSGKTGMILIVFRPHGVKSFFNFPITELLNENLSLQDLAINETKELEDKLLNSPNNKQRVIHLENFLIKRLIQNNEFERVEHAIKIIENSKGQIKAQDIAQEVCLGIKQFERTFSKYVGVNPKKFASIIRLQNVIQMKSKHKKSMTQIAFDSGYYDQSHFIHDFKCLTGLTPNAFFNTQK
ncbi:MAG: helix-turn-helix domain-containing protein [Bacteroidetes bacterium]|nr:helix-turn-helix domain-containing protein [Bacteroidota bacterium]MBU1116901.1 helix-turn-helix domain-containing protein [Bacteroidota bacterium]MBU1797421.1 helix-turn-helix domain-containing protein [Bacteroidota bacterium]